MAGGFFNYSLALAETRGERSGFLNTWWRLQREERLWTPPEYAALRQVWVDQKSTYVQRLDPAGLKLAALPRLPAGPQAPNPLYVHREMPSGAAAFEQVVATAALLCDRRNREPAAYLSMLTCANDVEVLERLAWMAGQVLAEAGYRRLIGPLGFSPHLGGGLLVDSWQEVPPQDTAYNPPYLPELVEAVFSPRAEARLYHLDVPAEPQSDEGQALLEPLDPPRLAGDLLPLLAAADTGWSGAPPPDGDEAGFLLDWLGRWPLHAFLASVKGTPAGFVLLQGDYSGRLRQAGGGRSLPGRLLLNWSRQASARRGRIVLGGVLPAFRRQGIGRQLLLRALDAARRQGWTSLLAGPLPAGSPAATLLAQFGAGPRQTYRLYQMDF